MKIFDNRSIYAGCENNKFRQNYEDMTVEEFFGNVNDNDFLHLGETKIVVYDNNYFDEDMGAPIFNSLELDKRQWNSKVLIAHIFKKLVFLMIA